MYAPTQFREDRQDVLLAAIGDIRLAALVVSAADGLEAAHIPMIARADAASGLVLEGHVARGNPLWRLAEGKQGVTALAVFQGPQAYVHPGWLATKHETGKAVPTWNYVAVHAHGRLKAVSDVAWLLRHLDHLSTHTEAGRADPWSIDDAPEGYIGTLMRGIVGIELRVDRLEGVWKMIQHHPEANRTGVIAGLDADGTPDSTQVAAVMRALEAARSD